MSKLLTALRRQAYLPTPLAVITNPIYIIRRGLFKSISRIAPTLTGNILDFGCGSKPYESLFINAASYTGVDIEVSGHDHVASKVDVYYDGKALPFPDNHFDAIVCFEVFEHLFNIDEIIVELRRVLKDDGQMLVTLPFAWDEHETPYDFARYTSYGIRHVLQRNRFEVRELLKTTTYVAAVCQMFIAYLVQHALPQGRFSRRLAQIFIVFPLNFGSLVLDNLLPKRYDYFCNTVVLSVKTRG